MKKEGVIIKKVKLLLTNIEVLIKKIKALNLPPEANKIIKKMEEKIFEAFAYIPGDAKRGQEKVIDLYVLVRKLQEMNLPILSKDLPQIRENVETVVEKLDTELAFSKIGKK